MITKQPINVVAFAIDNASLILYTDKGDVVSFQQGDANIELIVPVLTKELMEQGKSVATVHVMTQNKENIFERLVKAGANLVKLFNTMMGEPTTALADKDNNVIIPDITAAEVLLGDAVQSGNTDGAVKFLERIQQLAAKRNYSAEDLVRFTKKHELPLTVNGELLAFKSVYKRVDNDTGEVYYVDCHTRTVRQGIGDIVRMDESKVDSNRNVHCSNGLHIATLGYAASFSGDALILVRVNPEHIISVPSDCNTKIRASEYKILAEMKNRSYSAINDDKVECAVLANAVAGKEPVTRNIVFIDGEYATTENVKIDEAGTEIKAESVKQKKTSSAKAAKAGLSKSRKLVDADAVKGNKTPRGKKVAPTEVAGQKVSVVEQVYLDYKAGTATAQDVYDAYRKNKRPWSAHNISKDEAGQIVAIVKGK